MKKLLLTFSLILSAGVLYAQTNLFFPAPGKVAEYSVKVTSPMGNQEMTSVQQSFITDKIVEVKNVMTPAGDASASQSVTLKYEDKGDWYVTDLQDALKTILGALGDYSIELISGDLRYPKTLKVGDTFPEVKAKVSANVQGMALSVNILITGRTVEAKETIEVPAGKFECFRFAEKTEVEVMGQKQTFEVTSWFSPGVGLVKQNGSAQNGMVSSVTELVSVK